MASAWVERRKIADGKTRYRVKFRLGGSGTRKRYAGSFTTMREAAIRKQWVIGELAARRVPEFGWDEPTASPTFAESAKAWQAARVDVAASTRDQHRIQIEKLIPLIGTSRIDALGAGDFIDVVATLHANGTARETIRKTLGAAAMILDHAGIAPNPARDRSIKLPRQEVEELNPPSAVHVETVYRLIPSKHRLPLLFLDWSGARVSAIDLTLVSDYDEPRRRVRLRAATTKTRKALWVDLHPLIADALEASLPPREDRDPNARLFAGSGGDALRTSIGKACRAAGIPTWSPHDLRHRRISLLHLQGWPWAKIGAFVGQRDLTVTANTYTHVLVDEAEVDYAKLVA